MNKKERIYLQDWLFNAGIVGLLKALGVEYLKDGKAYNAENKVIEGIKAEDNFVEVERRLFENFSEKYYRAAALKELIPVNKS